MTDAHHVTILRSSVVIVVTMPPTDAVKYLLEAKMEVMMMIEPKRYS